MMGSSGGHSGGTTNGLPAAAAFTAADVTTDVTGVVRTAFFTDPNGAAIGLGVAGDAFPRVLILPSQDNTGDFIYFGDGANDPVSGNPGGIPFCGFGRDSDGGLLLNTGAQVGDHLHVVPDCSLEVESVFAFFASTITVAPPAAAPPSPAPIPDSVNLFTQDNGAGKAQLMAWFPTGAPVVIATEP